MVVKVVQGVKRLRTISIFLNVESKQFKLFQKTTPKCIFSKQHFKVLFFLLWSYCLTLFIYFFIILLFLLLYLCYTRFLFFITHFLLQIDFSFKLFQEDSSGSCRRANRWATIIKLTIYWIPEEVWI